MNSTDKLEMQIAEDADGSATVILDEELKAGGVVEGHDDDHDPEEAKHAADDEAEALVAG